MQWKQYRRSERGTETIAGVFVDGKRVVTFPEAFFPEPYYPLRALEPEAQAEPSDWGDQFEEPLQQDAVEQVPMINALALVNTTATSSAWANAPMQARSRTALTVSLATDFEYSLFGSPMASTVEHAFPSHAEIMGVDESPFLPASSAVEAFAFEEHHEAEDWVDYSLFGSPLASTVQLCPPAHAEELPVFNFSLQEFNTGVDDIDERAYKNTPAEILLPGKENIRPLSPEKLQAESPSRDRSETAGAVENHFDFTFRVDFPQAFSTSQQPILYREPDNTQLNFNALAAGKKVLTTRKGVKKSQRIAPTVAAVDRWINSSDSFINTGVTAEEAKFISHAYSTLTAPCDCGKPLTLTRRAVTDHLNTAHQKCAFQGSKVRLMCFWSGCNAIINSGDCTKHVMSAHLVLNLSEPRPVCPLCRIADLRCGDSNTTNMRHLETCSVRIARLESIGIRSKDDIRDSITTLKDAVNHLKASGL